MRVELDESACAMDDADESLILLQDRFNAAREELNESACAMAAAAESPI